MVLTFVILTGVRWSLRALLIYISLMVKDGEHILGDSQPFKIPLFENSSSGNFLSKCVPHFKNCLICCFLCLFWFLYIFYVLALCQIWVGEDIFSLCGLLFCPFDLKKPFSFMSFHFFMSIYFWEFNWFHWSTYQFLCQNHVGFIAIDL